MPLLLAQAGGEHHDEHEAKPTLVKKLVPYGNFQALIGYYCSIFGLVPIAGLLLGPVALLFGILGVKYAHAHPEMKGLNHALFAVILGTAELTAHIIAPLTLVIFIPEDVLRDLFQSLGIGP
jgi:hypothetical protein